jgi:hypothetical protein
LTVSLCLLNDVSIKIFWTVTLATVISNKLIRYTVFTLLVPIILFASTIGLALSAIIRDDIVWDGHKDKGVTDPISPSMLISPVLLYLNIGVKIILDIYFCSMMFLAGWKTKTLERSKARHMLRAGAVLL